MNKLRLLDLFSGIGGFSLGLERTGGFETVAFCEIEPFPRKILNKHWPEVPIYEDIRDLTASRLRADGIAVDAICGGFPCQDISTAGKGAGIEGERSGLWSEYARLIGELRPRVVFVENVAALLSRGLDKVLGDLASLGYDAEWHCIPASAIGAHHHRDRVWIIAYADGCDVSDKSREVQSSAEAPQGAPQGEHGEWLRPELSAVCSNVANPVGAGLEGHAGNVADGDKPGWQPSIAYRPVGSGGLRKLLSDTGCRRGERERGRLGGGSRAFGWLSEPDVGRVAHGVPDRVHRLKALGNAVVPQIPELLGNAYLESIGWRQAA